MPYFYIPSNIIADKQIISAVLLFLKIRHGMKLKIKFIATFLLTLALIILLSMQMGQLPPMGKFLDPVNGIWQNALISDIPKSVTTELDELSEEVTVVFNDRGVPHIFARNDHDLYFATGYVMAMHRLWQMEFTTHASMGRLSEILGDRTLEFDRYLRRLGMVYGAEKMLEAVAEDEATMLMLNAFANGVNAWIEQLHPRHYPFEYKLLNYAPEKWSPVKTMALGMSINRTLSSSNNALRLSYMKAAWGEETITELFAGESGFNEPVITAGKRRNFSLQPPAAPDDLFFPSFIYEDLLEERNPNTGSNNWAVAGSRTGSGNALFATDPHLGLTLPSIWYEMQLHAPGINAYGVTFPGVPTIIMGFNEHVAWGNTNAGNKVLDIYEIELNDEGTHYLHDKQWLPLTFRTEEYRIRGEKPLTDTIPFTHHGPVMYRKGERPFAPNIPVAHAISWTGHRAGNVIAPLRAINTSESISHVRKALSSLNAPPQNYAIADRNGDIAMQSNGLWPLRWKYQGMFISDGRDPAYNLENSIPFENLPHEINPARGFVSSANQHITDFHYPYWHGWFFASPARASIINQTLHNTKSATIEDMKRLQLNADAFWAGQYLEAMLDSVRHFLQQYPGHMGSISEEVLDSLDQWDRIFHPESIAATIFEQWRNEVFTLLWEPLMEPVKEYRPVRPPIDVSFRVLFHEPPAQVYEGLHGSPPATSALLAQSLENVITRLEENNGAMGKNWQWWNFNGSTINHLMNIKALNHERLKVGGSSQSPKAISNNHGPSWRMVAELSDTIQAWGIYPGGQAANPATGGYKAFIQDWAEGHYYQLSLFNHPEEAQTENSTTVRLVPAGKMQSKQQ